MEPSFFQQRVSPWKTGWHDHDIANWQHIRRGGFFLRDIEQFKAAKLVCINPRSINKNGVIADITAGAFEMQTTSDHDRSNSIFVSLEELTQLLEAGLIGAPRYSNKKGARDSQHIAAVQSCRLGEKSEWPITGQSFRYIGDFASPALCTHVGNDANLIQHHRRIFHKDRIRECRLRRQGNNFYIELCQTAFVSLMLRNCFSHVYRPSPMKRELTVIDAGTYLSRDGDCLHSIGAG